MRRPISRRCLGRIIKMNSKWVAAVAAIAVVLSAPAARAQAFINVLTGGTSGVYYPLGVAIGKIFSDKIPDVKTQVQATKASVENLILLQQAHARRPQSQEPLVRRAQVGDRAQLACDRGCGPAAAG